MSLQGILSYLGLGSRTTPSQPPTTSNSASAKDAKPATKTYSEEQRIAYLLDAQSKAVALFTDIANTIIRPGISEAAMSKEIYTLAASKHGVQNHWHKRVVRSGPHTLEPYKANPPDRVVGEDDILFVDLGPIFEAWEADFGRTFVLGTDPEKERLRDALEPTWKAVKARFDERLDVTGEQMYAIACEEASRAGYEFGGVHCGHLVGDYPHERIPNDQIRFYMTKGSDGPMRSVDEHGNKRHWILEIHLVDRERQIGGFMEQLLTAD